VGKRQRQPVAGDLREVVHKVPMREWGPCRLVGASGSCGQLPTDYEQVTNLREARIGPGAAAQDDRSRASKFQMRSSEHLKSTH